MDAILARVSGKRVGIRCWMVAGRRNDKREKHNMINVGKVCRGLCSSNEVPSHPRSHGVH